MTDERKLNMLKSLNEGLKLSDEVFSTYLWLAKEKILSRLYPFDRTQTELPQKYDALHLEITQFLINKRGAEGVVRYSDVGVRLEYENGDVPESMLRGIVPFVGIL